MRGLGVNVAVDDELDSAKVLRLGPAIFYPLILDEGSKKDYYLLAVGFDAVGGIDIDEGDSMGSSDP